MSGAGRSEAAHVLEDLGFFVIDNLPPMLIGEGRRAGPGPRRRHPLRAGGRRALRRLPDDLATAIDELRNARRHRAHAVPRRADDVLVRRYEESRRRHPLSDSDRVGDGITRERRARTAHGRGRPHRRHVDAQRARAPRPPARAVLADGDQGSVRVADRTSVVRLQARSPDRRRPRVRLPLPAEPALGRGAAAELPASTRPSATTCSRNASRRPFLEELDRLFALLIPALRARGQVVPRRSARLHRRTPSQRGDGRAAGASCFARRGTAAVVHHRDVDRGWPTSIDITDTLNVSWMSAFSSGPVPGGPNVVALGGGHGLAAALQAARRYAGSVTAIVSVADDGGSSGRLRRTLGVAPPGDLRKRLVAAREPKAASGRPRSSTVSSIGGARGARARQPRARGPRRGARSIAAACSRKRPACQRRSARCSRPRPTPSRSRAEIGGTDVDRPGRDPAGGADRATVQRRRASCPPDRARERPARWAPSWRPTRC